MKKPIPHDWNQVWKKLGQALPGLTETDSDFAKHSMDEIVHRLIQRTGRDYDEVVAAMRSAGIVVPGPNAVREVKVSESNHHASHFAGEGLGIQEFPADRAETAGA